MFSRHPPTGPPRLELRLTQLRSPTLAFQLYILRRYFDWREGITTGRWTSENCLKGQLFKIPDSRKWSN
ncbi:unnamed protein product [Protopolystoma xenopodis]|uniref:Uncharacterized protein n=1 Tax=Protopolystoma xenopodis TaxID=117903 RepID=A0A3S5FEQ9_9PLAT|nr:unnamed protein product [Protopolystoma xenopodis]